MHVYSFVQIYLDRSSICTKDLLLHINSSKTLLFFSLRPHAKVLNCDVIINLFTSSICQRTMMYFYSRHKAFIGPT